MTTRYQNEHYEDVAGLLKRHVGSQTSAAAHVFTVDIVKEFADLFAADNPPNCYVNGEHNGPCSKENGCLHGGFDRERFLAACGLP